MKKITIFGSLNYPKLEDVANWVSTQATKEDQIIVQVGTRVGDAALAAALKKGITNTVRLKPRTSGLNPSICFNSITRAMEFGNRTYYMFLEMLSRSDKIVVFWDGESHGAKFLIDLANQQKVDVNVIKLPYTGQTSMIGAGYGYTPFEEAYLGI